MPIIGPSYVASSSNVAAGRCVNWFVEMTEGKSGRVPSSLRPTPGLTLKTTLGDGPWRGAVDFQDTAYIVSGANVYKMTTAFASTLLGTIGTASGRVGIATNGAQVLIVDGSSGYIIDIETGTLTEIADPDFPRGVTHADYMDGYFVVSGGNLGYFYISAVLDGVAWDGTDFANAEGAPDDVVGHIVDQRQVFVLGKQTTEIFVNTGNADFPLERVSNAFIEVGCVAPHSICKLDTAVFWVAQDTNGSGLVVRCDGYRPQRISDHYIERLISENDPAEATAYTFQQGGHSFYVLTFGQMTVAYNVSTGLWHEWLGFDDNTGEFVRHRSAGHIYFAGFNLVGDFENGNIYAIDPNARTDAGDMICRLRRWGPDKADGNWYFFHELEVLLQAGVGIAAGQGSEPIIMLRYSNDGGHTWSAERSMSMGAMGAYTARARAHMLGRARERVYEIRITDPVLCAVIGERQRVTKGA